MDQLLKDLLMAPGISGYEEQVAHLIKTELEKSCESVKIDNFGNVISKKGTGKKKIMIATHMDEIGLAVKYINEQGFIYFIKVGGISDGVLPGQRVIIKAQKGDVYGIIGTKPPHLQTQEERNKVVTHDNMFIDIGCANKDEVLTKIDIGDQIVFEPNAGILNGDIYYGKAVDNRVGCYAMIKVMEKIAVNAEVYGVATAQEEVGLKGAKTSSFAVNPDFALIIDTTTAGDVPGIEGKVSSLKLGSGIAITLIEASGRGTIVSNKIRKMMIEVARENNIKHQIDVIDGGMTDGANIYMNREGILTAILSVPTRYLHASSSVFDVKDLQSAIELSIKAIEKFVNL